MALPDLQGALWAWVQTLPPWQSDLLRRLTTLDELSEDELADATRMILASFGVLDDQAPLPVIIPALIASAAHRVTRILALKDLVAVGSVEAGQRLDFVPDGLTIVFGETGSGKSSYARVLRKACRSSAKPIEILPNVLNSSAGGGPARAGTAQIEISIDGATSLIRRDVNAAPEAYLAEVSVFDSDCANVYADEESEITYTPSSLRLLERLVSLQAQLRKRIDDEISTLNAATLPMEGVDPSTKAGALIGALNENVSPDTVTALATLSPDELAKLDELRAQVAAARAKDPLLAASQLEKRATAVDDLASAIEAYAAQINDHVVGALLALNATLAELSEASAELSAALSTTSATKVGGLAWKAFWQSAHAYVASLSGKAVPFPPGITAVGAHCPLCQQVLEEEALHRLDRFEEHFRGEIEKAIDEARAERKRQLADISSVPSEARRRATQIGVLLGDDPVLEVAVEAFLAAVGARAEAIEASGAAPRIEAPPLAPGPSADVRVLASELRRKAVEQRALATPEAIAKAVREIAEFENRLLLARQRDAVLTRIANLKRIAKLRSAFSALATTGLSRRIGEFTESAVTEQLRARLASELQALGGDHIPVMIGARGAKGKTKVSLQLHSTRRVDVGDVLSEGERRAVAVAFFLAEVAVAEHGGGIVLDDPVSSLDHTRRSYVAHRLVQEAARRQTIVFTHDVVFLLELQDQARQASRLHEVRVVRRIGTASGIASQQLPWVAQNVKTRIGQLRAEMQTLGALERKGDAEVYRRQAKVWFEMLREAWERAVEEKLFGGVVGRFQPSIETMRLKAVEVTPAMTASVEKGMTRASAWTHDQAAALGRPPPTAADLASALGELDTFVAQFKK